MKSKITKICSFFNIEGEFKNCELLTDGNINTTYKVCFIDNGKNRYYVLQRINTYVFNKPIEVMENILAITSHIKDKLKDKDDCGRLVLEYKVSKDNKAYVIDDNEFWRCYSFIDNSFTISQVDDLAIIEESGKAFGEFQLYLSDYNVNDLNIVIEDFHNINKRYYDFEKIINSDKLRITDNLKLINEYQSIKDFAMKIYDEELPLRVTHNDTKINNVLFDCNSNKHLAVIDLDTVMPGLVAYDYGDAIRFVASSSKEDEVDESKVYLNLEKFEAFTKGFLGVVKDSLSNREKETLVLGVIAITTELGLRFLSDYFEDDKYFKIEYTEHNLVRSKCQLKLVKDMILKMDEMSGIINKYCN